MSAKDYVAQFDEFLIYCSTFSTESNTQILFRFRAGLREDLQTELLARVIKLEKAYALVEDLDSIRTSHTFESHDYRASVSRPSLSPQPNRSSTQTHSHRYVIRGKSFERDNKNKGPEFPKVSSTT